MRRLDHCSICYQPFTEDNPRYHPHKAMHRLCYLDKYFPRKDGVPRIQPALRTPDEIAAIDPSYKTWLYARRRRIANQEQRHAA